MTKILLGWTQVLSYWKNKQIKHRTKIWTFQFSIKTVCVGRHPLPTESIRLMKNFIGFFFPWLAHDNFPHFFYVTAHSHRWEVSNRKLCYHFLTHFPPRKTHFYVVFETDKSYVRLSCSQTIYHNIYWSTPIMLILLVKQEIFSHSTLFTLQIW